MKIAVGLSGGIDSAGTALILKEAGHEVIGITMQLFDHQTEELINAEKVAKQIGIDHHIIDFRSDFEALVISPFIRDYEAGQTPNPCLSCNRTLKYGKLLDVAKALGADRFATGHYVKIVYNQDLEQYQLLKAHHLEKDQSYNLFHLNQSRLSFLTFPLGLVESKATIRASYANLDVNQSNKKDSQGICFIQRGSQTHFLKSRNSSASQPGYFTDSNGKILGKHLGIAHYTIGQKRKLGIDLPSGHVVTAIDALKNQVVIGNEKDLLTETLTLSNFNFIYDPKSTSIDVEVKTSQWSPLYRAQMTLMDTQEVRLDFKTPVRGLTPGQAIVCYHGEALLGGAIYHL